jgi:hypothetical protein
MDQEPQCRCGKVMTRQNSTVAPEYFLCDDCARIEARSLDNVRWLKWYRKVTAKKTPSLALYHSRQGGHIHVRIFYGYAGYTRARCGDMTFRVEEWEEAKLCLLHRPNSLIEFHEEDPHGHQEDP